MMGKNGLQTQLECKKMIGNWDVFFMQERNRKAGSADSSSFLPARFDWSIMGCTILLLALMNLEGRREKKSERGKQNLNQVYADSSRANTKTSFARLNGNIKHQVLNRGICNKTGKQKGNCVLTWEPSERYF